jgi:hypothetical protein
MPRMAELRWLIKHLAKQPEKSDGRVNHIHVGDCQVRRKIGISPVTSDNSEACDCHNKIGQLTHSATFAGHTRFAGQDRVASWNPSGQRRDTDYRVFAYGPDAGTRQSAAAPLLGGCPTDGTTMNVPQLDTTRADFRLTRSVCWWDPDAECTLVMSQPSIDRGLWLDYLRGAERSYRRHGVERALDVAAIRNSDDTLMFWAMVDNSGRVIGGVRAKGPLKSADESHAVIEWAGRPGLHEVRKMITDRVPFGILEMKSAFVTDDPDRNRVVTRALARSGFHAMSLMNLQFCMATSAPHVLDRWRSSGGVVASIPATPYPDGRYRTKMMWWDRRTFANHAEPEQVSKILMEITAMNQQWHGAAAVGIRHENVL